MSDTLIEWADRVWNPITGCTKVSEGCEHCYAERMAHRLAGRYGYPKDKPFSVVSHPDKTEEPMHWKKPSRVFVCSMGDLFHEDVPFLWIAVVFGVMHTARQHTYMILTKRPKRMKEFFEWFVGPEWRGAWPREYKHVWLGVTAENQQRADERIPILLQIPAAKRFVSIEPMLGPVDLTNLDGGVIAAEYRGITLDALIGGRKSETPWHLNWVIAGGETGPGARPAHPNWFRKVRDDCEATGTAFFFKSWGDYCPVYADPPDEVAYHECYDAKTGQPIMLRVGKKRSGRLLDGREHNDLPTTAS